MMKTGGYVMRQYVGVIGCGVLAMLVPGSALTQQKPGVDIKIVNYDGLTRAVRDQRGKVVVVDFWGEF
jgi:hypothetical protein